MNLSPSKTCQSCQTPVMDRYCPHCGQEWSTRGLTLRLFLKEYFEKSIGIDSHFQETMKTLFMSPGKMTREYVSGRRQPYTHPVKFYFFCSVVFLFGLSLVPGLEILISKTGISVLTVSHPEFVVKSRLNISSIDDQFSMLTNHREVIKKAGLLLLLTIPLTALFLKSLFAKVPLVTHLVFSFHYHGLGLLVLLPGLIPWHNPDYHDAFNNLLSLTALLFLGAMLKEVYALTLRKTLIILPAFFCFYVISFIGTALLRVFVL